MADIETLSPRGEKGNVANDTDEKMRILVAEDDQAGLRAITDAVHRIGHVPLSAGNGKEALEILRAQGPQIDVIFLDHIMPYVDGPGVLRAIAQDPVLRDIPVIMQHGEGDKNDSAAPVTPPGVFYLLEKPYDMVNLQMVLNAAARQAQKNKRLGRRLTNHQRGFDALSSAKFRFRTIEEAEGLACFIANCFPEPAHVVTGLAELMINAIEHGNLRIGEEEKAALLKAGAWQREIEKRLADPAYAYLYAEIALTRRDGGIYIVITDQGEGFEWQNYIRIDPERAARPNGRGIAHAATACFDTLRYDHIGNKVIGFVHDREPLKW